MIRKKVLDRITGLVLYKTIRALTSIAQFQKETEMMMTRTNTEHTTKWQPSAAMRGVCLKVGLGLSAANIFSGGLGQATSIDCRYLRH